MNLDIVGSGSTSLFFALPFVFAETHEYNRSSRFIYARSRRLTRLCVVIYELRRSRISAMEYRVLLLKRVTVNGNNLGLK